MVNESTTTAEEAPKTEEQLMVEMDEAVKSGDYKLVAKVAQELVKFQRIQEQAELIARQEFLASKTEAVKAAIDKALAKMINDGDLDQVDGVWYNHDFGEKSTSCRLVKTAVRAKSSSSGKKFSISTSEMLEKFGNDEYKDGMSFQAAWDSNTDKNWRYGIRESLLKKAGLVS